MMGWGFGPSGMMGGWGSGIGYGGNWWMGLIGMALQLIFWIVIVWLGISFFRRLGTSGRNGSYGVNEALIVLRERYARGEIDAEEYQARKKDLQ